MFYPLFINYSFRSIDDIRVYTIKYIIFDYILLHNSKLDYAHFHLLPILFYLTIIYIIIIP